MIQSARGRVGAGDREGALKTLDRALSIEKRADGFALKARLHLEAKAWEAARDAARAARTADPKPFDAWLSEATAQRELKAWKDAAEAAQQALGLKGDSADAMRIRATPFTRLERWDEA